MNEQDKAQMLADLIIELTDGETEVDVARLTQKLNNAIRDVIRAINYPRSFTAKRIEDDLKLYYGNIHDLTLYDYNQMGAEGEVSHNENGTNRTWKSRKECFNGIVAYANGL